MNGFDVAIVGGGFSGLVLKNALADSGLSVAVFEKLDRVGKKILATGNGRGNVSNTVLSVDNYHGNNPDFCAYAIKKFDNRVIAHFFNERGVLLTDEEGRIYPAGLQANAVLDALRMGAKDGIVLNAEVKDITFDKRKNEFLLSTSSGSFTTKNVVLSVGGKAAGHFGTDGTSYRLAQKFGHKITPLYPSLVQMRADPDEIRGLKGVKQTAKVSLIIDGKTVKTAVGDLLFADNSVSGNTVFFLSAYVGGNKNMKISAEFVPEIESEKIEESLKIKRKAFPELDSDGFLSGVVHSRISQKIMRRAVGENKSLSSVTDDEILRAVSLIKNFTVSVKGLFGFDNAQVTRGGVDTLDVNGVTMESKLQKGLYFCGEVLDIDGDCGGYNLQWAFSSAKCVAEALLNGKD